MSVPMFYFRPNAWQNDAASAVDGPRLLRRCEVEARAAQGSFGPMATLTLVDPSSDYDGFDFTPDQVKAAQRLGLFG